MLDRVGVVDAQRPAVDEGVAGDALANLADQVIGALSLVQRADAVSAAGSSDWPSGVTT